MQILDFLGKDLQSLESALENGKSLNPRIKEIGNWVTSGVLYRSDIAETVLVSDPDTGKGSILTYILPNVLCGTPEYETFIIAAEALHKTQKHRFHPEMRAPRFSKKLSGIRYTSKGSELYATCLKCEQILSQDILNLSQNQRASCPNCSACIEFKWCDIWLPVIETEYQDYVSLKRILEKVERDRVQIPSVIFSRILYTVCSQLLILHKHRIPVSSSANSIFITTSGGIHNVPIPVGKCLRVKLSSAELLATISQYFTPFAAFVPDLSDALETFLLFPNVENLKALRKDARSATNENVASWMNYCVPALFGNENNPKDTYARVRELIAVDLSTTDQALFTPHKGYGDPKISSSKLQNYAIKADSTEKPSFIPAIIAKLNLVKGYSNFGRRLITIVILLSICSVFAFGMAMVQTPTGMEARPSAPNRSAALKSKPAIVVKKSISPELKLKLDNFAATVRVLVSTDGMVSRVEWVYATDEQKTHYSPALSQLKFDPASTENLPITTWTTIQLPLR